MESYYVSLNSNLKAKTQILICLFYCLDDFKTEHK